MRFWRHCSPEFSGKKRETENKSVSFIEQENSVETGLSLAKLHACIALLCLNLPCKISKQIVIKKKRFTRHIHRWTEFAASGLLPGKSA
jgi:hypothetical protein